MRIRTTMLAAAATGVLLLAGCGGGGGAADPTTRSEAVPTTVTAGPEVRPASGGAARRAADVVAAWPGSPAQQAWDHGYYPVEDTTGWLPRDAFHDGDDKAAYLDGRLDLAATLPVSVSGTSEVRFPDGSALTLPQRSAADVYTALPHRSDSCANHCDARLTVTAVRPGTTTVATSRGRATVPVWEFTVSGYTEPFRYPAVRSQAPPASGDVASPVPADGVPARLTAVSADGLLLTALVPYGCGTTVDPGTVYETDGAVVLIGRTTAHRLPAGQACDAALRFAPVEFRLSRPLGTRPVLGLADGRPQLPR